MTHPRGALTYAPSPNFVLQRSYFDDVRWDAESHLGFTQSGSLFTLTYSPLPLYRAYVKFDDRFWNWSSNTYTLDFIIEYCYEQLSPSDPETDAGLTVALEFDTNIKRFAVVLRTVSPSVNHYYDLPARNQPYWRPDLP